MENSKFVASRHGDRGNVERFLLFRIAGVVHTTAARPRVGTCTWGLLSSVFT